MGETGIAATADANAIFWNLAKAGFAEDNSGIGITYTPWLRRLGLNDVYLATLAGYYKIDDNQALAGSLRYFSLGNIQFTDFNGTDLQTFRPKEFSIDAGYTRKLSAKAGIGISLRYISSTLASGISQSGSNYKTGHAVAGDLSFYYNGQNTNGEGWTAGATLTNLGSKIGYTDNAAKKDFIPAGLGIGVARQWQIEEENQLSVELDIHKSLVPSPATDAASLAAYHQQTVAGSWLRSFSDAPGGFSEELKEYQVSVGAEYSYQKQFFLRAGFFYEDKTKGNRQYATLGAGVKYNIAQLNISWIIPAGSGVSQNPLSNTLRFSLVFALVKE